MKIKDLSPEQVRGIIQTYLRSVSPLHRRIFIQQIKPVIKEYEEK